MTYPLMSVSQLITLLSILGLGALFRSLVDEQNISEIINLLFQHNINESDKNDKRNA